jgi:hypothetical protein
VTIWRDVGGRDGERRMRQRHAVMLSLTWAQAGVVFLAHYTSTQINPKTGMLDSTVKHIVNTTNLDGGANFWMSSGSRPQYYNALKNALIKAGGVFAGDLDSDTLAIRTADGAPLYGFAPAKGKPLSGLSAKCSRSYHLLPWPLR